MRIILPVVALLAVAFAGCSEDATPDDSKDGPALDVTEDTGGIRGVVVDQSIMPVEGATVSVLNTEFSSQTDADGLFTFTGLEPGTYFLKVEKLLYDGVQTSVDVEAGVAEPNLLNIQITRLITAAPFAETIQFDGFYECAFAYIFITDSCDMAARTAHDAGATVVPRQVQNNVNTQFHPFADTTLSIVQEGFWDEDSTPRMWMMVDSTPIDNGCDCSDHNYVTATSGPPTYGRADVPEAPSPPGNWPAAGQDVAIRGFIPFTDEATEVAYAIDVKFQIFTTFFHNYIPQDGWNIEEKDQYPVPS